MDVIHVNKMLLGIEMQVCFTDFAGQNPTRQFSLYRLKFAEVHHRELDALAQ